MRRHVVALLERAVLPVVGALAFATLMLACFGFNPIMVIRGFVLGSAGSLSAISETLVRACPLLLIGLGAAIAFRAGVWNIGGEGQFVAGAIAVAAFAGLAVSSRLAALALAFLTGAAVALFASWLRSWRGVNIVISTLLLNFVLILLLGYLVRGPLQERARQYPQTEALPLELRLPRMIDGTRLHTGIPLALGAYLVVTLVLTYTIFGFRLRAIGAGREAAAISGIAVERYAHAAMLLSGGLGGLSGAIEASGVTYRLYETFPSGAGFTGIAVALVARLHPAAVLPAALLFGALQSATTSLQREMRISSALSYLVQGVILLAILALDGWRARIGRTGAP